MKINNVFTPNGWVRVKRLVVRVFGKEIHIPDNAMAET